MLKKFSMILAMTAMVAGSPAFAAEKGADKAAAEASIAAAKAAQTEAKAANGEWRDTGDMLEKAEKAVEAGELDEAVKLANKAKFQYETGASQMAAQEGVGNPAYLK